MKMKKIIEVFRSLGWKFARDEVGDFVGRMKMGAFQQQIIPAIKRGRDDYYASLMTSVSTEEFSSAVAYVYGRKSEFIPVIVRHGGPQHVGDLSAQLLAQLSDEALEWGQCQDLERGLEEYRSLPTDAKGEMPLRHLAALAIAGDVSRLSTYVDKVRGGDSLGFVPYIKLEMIERALILAEHKKVE
jgi:hypothetical protein